MEKNLSYREKTRRMYRKMHRSLANKMHGENLVWWNSLTRRSQYSLVFKYRTMKLRNKDNKVDFKYFIRFYKPRYVPTMQNFRNSAIEEITKEQKKKKI